ncbi:hypothetical protein GWI33_015901 [Rhynchophorus ferrugineus]|uniref:CCDC66 domain-containing protein n=1 Tax=Rhynchophorus ferrugineus TaxID=354439 RepID=A0A834I4I5_RHYFE|nr:hypothetical protein GWI33_015901 [Rhynchophorus ferrugineus]
MTTSGFSVKPMSLVERKKLQWAKEREELANLGAPFKNYSQSFDRPLERARYGSRLSMVPKQVSLDGYPKEMDRRSSLPPLCKNQLNSNYDYHKGEKTDRGGETSGYGSDNNSPPDYKELGLPPAGAGQWTGGHQSGYESSSSYRDDRPKWGDKGVGLGKFWQPKEENYEKVAHEPPNWVKRGLQVDGAIVVANSSPSASPEQGYDDRDRPCTGSSSSPNKCFIRGQNIHIDAVEMAERERKRQIALAHQEAIRQQLEERERRRQEEKARRIREEREEELRIEREQEHDRQKRLQEEKAHQDKLERERRRKEAIREAMEMAEKEARLEKIRLKMLKQCNNKSNERNMVENVVDKEKLSPDIVIEPDINDHKHLNNTREVCSNQNLTKPDVNKEINNNLAEEAPQMPPSPTKSTTSLPQSVLSDHLNNNNRRSLTPINQSPRNNNGYTPRVDQLAYILQPSLEGLQSLHQYALLVPTVTAQFPLAIPVSFPPPPEPLNTTRTENRILTPTRYRNNIPKCDSSTQTDPTVLGNSARSSTETNDSREKFLREKLNNLDVSYDGKRRERRSRSESTDERPKWGVNRPPTRYMKQSEKDPLYQRRKLRQKRENANKSYDEKNSSDDSQGGTPRHYRKKELIEKRPSRARWRAEERIFSGNVKMYQREIIPLEADRDQLYYKCCCTCRCQKHGCGDGIKIDILKIGDDTPRTDFKTGYSSGSNDRLNKDLLEPNLAPEETTKLDLLAKLTSLHNGLVQEQARWDNSPRT